MYAVTRQAPVLCMAWGKGGHVASGDRSGNVCIWDIGVGRIANQHDAAHTGHATAMSWLPSMPNILLTGGQVCFLPSRHPLASSTYLVSNIGSLYFWSRRHRSVLSTCVTAPY